MFPGQRAVSAATLAAAAVFPVLLTTAYAALWQCGEQRRKAFLGLSLVVNLGLLGFFKYFNFFAESAAVALRGLGMEPGWTLLHIILPVGISFYTFQTLSYTVDVYRGRLQPTDDFLTYATYLAFFPQLVAGPIERSTDLLPQLQKAAVWDTANFHRGLRLILVGLFKKVFVADNCALLANHAFASTTSLNAPWALLGVVAFAFQIYGDFSGYSDIARGAARLLGIHLTHNFHFPYFARGPSEFWQRWHITLSSWFRDYVYIPLGGNRHGTFATLRNLVLTMGLAGLWHGAAWTFVIWGLYHGALLVLYRIVPPLRALSEEEKPSRARFWLGVAVMGGFTLVGWVIFRSADVAQMMAWFAALTNWTSLADCAGPAWWLLFHSAPLLLLQAATWKHRDEVEIAQWPWGARGVAYALLILMVATSAVSEQEFIYFQF
jgi:alginate O-acetyltransferase complex protein AlgI